MVGYFDKVALSEVTLVGNQIIRGLSYFFPAFNYRVPLMTSQNTDKENELCCSYFLEKYLHWVINLRKIPVATKLLAEDEGNNITECAGKRICELSDLFRIYLSCLIENSNLELIGSVPGMGSMEFLYTERELVTIDRLETLGELFFDTGRISGHFFTTFLPSIFLTRCLDFSQDIKREEKFAPSIIGVGSVGEEPTFECIFLAGITPIIQKLVRSLNSRININENYAAQIYVTEDPVQKEEELELAIDSFLRWMSRISQYRQLNSQYFKGRFLSMEHNVAFLGLKKIFSHPILVGGIDFQCFVQGNGRMDEYAYPVREVYTTYQYFSRMLNFFSYKTIVLNRQIFY